MSFYSLKGSARYEEQDGRTALYLDGTSGTFAETPSLPIHRTNLTIAVWIKMKSSGAQYAVYGDWSYPWSFQLYINSSSHFCAQARNEAGKTMMNFCTRYVSSHLLIIFITDVWSSPLSFVCVLILIVTFVSRGEMKIV